MIVLVCGDREWIDQAVVNAVLSEIHNASQITAIVEGEARGADSCARTWALRHFHVRLLKFPANWKKYGRAAGPIRNREQYDETQPDMVAAFHDNLAESRGTRDMVMYALSQGCKQIMHVTHSSVTASGWGWRPIERGTVL